jgi:hypothetical protein
MEWLQRCVWVCVLIRVGGGGGVIIVWLERSSCVSMFYNMEVGVATRGCVLI